MTLKHSEVKDLALWLNDLGQPFAKALATFVHESRRLAENAMPAVATEPCGHETRCAVIDNTVDTVEPIMLDELPDKDRIEINNRLDENARLAQSGRLPRSEFTADTPAVFAANRLRAILDERQISQKALAERLGVTAGFVSKVLKNPDRSKVVTLRQFASAIGVELRELL